VKRVTQKLKATRLALKKPRNVRNVSIASFDARPGMTTMGRGQATTGPIDDFIRPYSHRSTGDRSAPVAPVGPRPHLPGCSSRMLQGWKQHDGR
jgi:hypothetical protein